MLLVLDPTPSTRLDDLTAEFAKYGGAAYVGEGAWQHISAKAGTTMTTFVTKYIRKPLTEVDAAYNRAGLLPIRLTGSGTSVAIRIGNRTFTVTRPGAEDYADTESEPEPQQ